MADTDPDTDDAAAAAAEPRPVTLLLQAPEDAKARTPAMRALGAANDVVRSPLFVFLVGSSLVGFWPKVDGWMHPARAADERNRADIALVLPLISGLRDDDTIKLDATQAILRRLRDSGAKASDDGESPIFAAAYDALTPVAAQARPSPSATASDDALAKIAQDVAPAPPAPTPTVDRSGHPSTAQASGPTTAIAVGPEATPAANVPASAPSLAALGQAALVYIQAARDSAVSKAKAASLLQALQADQVLAPAVQNMACRTIPRSTQVRFFNEADRSKAADLAAFVAYAVGVPTGVVRPQLAAKPGTLEVWIGRDVDPGLSC